MNALFDFFDMVGAAIKARLRRKAQADLEAGKKILAQAEREAKEMELASKRESTDPNWPPPIPPKPEGNSNG